jgi:hypothetical protein
MFVYKEIYTGHLVFWHSITFPAIAAALKGNEATPYFAVWATITSGIMVLLELKDEKHKFNVVRCSLRKTLKTESGTKSPQQSGGVNLFINAEPFQEYAPNAYTDGRRVDRGDRVYAPRRIPGCQPRSRNVVVVLH